MKRIKQSLNRLKIDVDKGWEKENILSNILDNEDPPAVERKKGGEIRFVLLISIFLEGPIKFVYSVSFNQESPIEIRAQTLVTKVRNSHLFLKHAYRIYTQKTTRVEQRNTKPVFPLTNQVAPFENCLYLFAHSSLVELVHNRCWLVHL